MGKEEWDLQTGSLAGGQREQPMRDGVRARCTQHREDVQEPRDSQGAAVLSTEKMFRSPEILREPRDSQGASSQEKGT